MSRVLVFGSINMDLVVETGTFPRLGETLPGASFATHAGGKGANQAVAAARLGARVTHARPGGIATRSARSSRRASRAEGVATRWVQDTPDVSSRASRRSRCATPTTPSSSWPAPMRS